MWYPPKWEETGLVKKIYIQNFKEENNWKDQKLSMKTEQITFENKGRWNPLHSC